VRLDARLKHLLERAEGVVVVMAGDLPDQLCRPLLAGLRGDFVQAQTPKFRPGLLELAQTPQSVFFALRLDRRVMLKLPLEQFHRLTELRRVDFVPVFSMLLQEIVQPQLRGCPNRCL
jgi:hypothetical protein